MFSVKIALDREPAISTTNVQRATTLPSEKGNSLNAINQSIELEPNLPHARVSNPVEAPLSFR